ncbi:MAG: MarR family transcriptional regulator [Anaerolineaceae bacterium]|nr:MarR family transcriptional regulator [Anaerolineaceae bacterium]MBN2678521.1 MarR family transcriptional regulator [Anaerolineaceae bacterium]
MTNQAELIQTLIHWLELSTTHSLNKWQLFIKGTGLSMPQFGFLMHLYHQGSCVITDFSRLAGVSNAATSQLVTRLVEKKLIIRKEDPSDRRVKRLNLTARGRQLVKASINERYVWVNELVTNLSQNELENLIKSLPSLINGLQKLNRSHEVVHQSSDTDLT